MATPGHDVSDSGRVVRPGGEDEAMIIRQEQAAVFEEAILHNFENDMVEHLKQKFPKHCRFLGEENLRRRVQEGLERAKSHGLQSINGLRLFLELIFLLGSGFDTDPQLPWAADILKEAPSNESACVARLYERALDYLNEVLGPKCERLEQALSRWRAQPVERFPQAGRSSYESHAMARLRELFPEKCRYLGEDRLRQLIQASVEAVTGCGLRSERGLSVYLGLAFLLGAGFAADLQCPFAAEVLNDKSLADPNARADRLHAAAVAHLERWNG
jgi:hypothetical protein